MGMIVRYFQPDSLEVQSAAPDRLVEHRSWQAAAKDNQKK